MTRQAVAVLAVLLAAGCSGSAPSKSEQEDARAALQKEAEGLKRDGEKMNPALGVTAVWTIKGIDIQEQAGNAERPLAGTIRFVITSRTNDPTGSAEQNFEKNFRYEYDSALKQWLLKP